MDGVTTLKSCMATFISRGGYGGIINLNIPDKLRVTFNRRYMVYYKKPLASSMELQNSARISGLWVGATALGNCGDEV
jgi:hypothetical protein